MSGSGGELRPPGFFTAARLIALVPISSASAERVFSQVKFIIETVGVNMIEETLETRVMERLFYLLFHGRVITIKK